MRKVNWNKRKWLNELDSHYTGSVSTFDGINIINQGKILPRYTFVELADCHGKVRIHRDMNFSMAEFRAKLYRLEREIRDFRRSLEDDNFGQDNS